MGQESLRAGGVGDAGGAGGEQQTCATWGDHSSAMRSGSGEGWESGRDGGAARAGRAKGGGDDYTVFPRRKVGRAAKASGPGERAPVVLTEDKLRECFNLPLHVASKKMGICITAIKKVCRKFGIHKWPYREMKERKVGVRACSCVCMCVHACACLPACLRKASPGKRAREGWCTGKPGKGWGEKMESRPDE